jgi:hypothetical protein
MKLFDNQLILKWEGTMRSHIPTGPQRDQFLIRLVAALGIALTFQRAYTTIFGSQLRALQALNSGLSTGTPIAALRSTYDAAAAAEPKFYANYSFESWLQYLRSFSLVVKADEVISITLEGREFLKWLVEQGLDTNKSY